MLHAWLQSLQDSTLASAIREGDRLFPWIEGAHVLAMTLVIGSIAIVDLRLIGLTSRERGVTQMTTLALPITWSAFVAAVITGGLLFSSNATVYAHNACLQAKLALLGLAGMNMGAYHLLLGKDAAAWRTAALTPWRARVVGGISLCLWIAIAACGRWIGFTLSAHG
ncbi:MAG: hypothetical protein JSR67_15170 [Proteobacteria bacterium]|nr:hypothetical protein [Pseudomonadota bacterium]